MEQTAERRKCQRFSIPGAKVKYKKAGILRSIKGFSKKRTMFNVGEDGMAFLCEEKFDPGESLTIQLLAPDDPPLVLLARVKWQGEQMMLTGATTGVEFLPFDNGKGSNTPEVLQTIRNLEERYKVEDKEDSQEEARPSPDVS
jgi:hypothetical protein